MNWKQKYLLPPLAWVMRSVVLGLFRPFLSCEIRDQIQDNLTEYDQLRTVHGLTLNHKVTWADWRALLEKLSPEDQEELLLKAKEKLDH